MPTEKAKGSQPTSTSRQKIKILSEPLKSSEKTKPDETFPPCPDPTDTTAPTTTSDEPHSKQSSTTTTNQQRYVKTHVQGDEVPLPTRKPPCHQAPRPHKTESKREQQRRGRRSQQTTDTTRQTTLNDYYQVRRSTRKCKSHIESEKYDEISSKLRAECEDNLEVVKDEIKGRGVVTTIPRVKGDFICEYSGELISFEEAKTKEAEYSKDSDVGCYMYYFEHKSKKYCVDATEDNGRMGRLLNHSRTEPNVNTKLHEVDGRPVLCLMASQNIPSKEELLYDYGERSKEVLQSHPWLES